MNFDVSEEQQMLRDSVARFVQDNYDFDSRQKIANSELGFSQENWATFAELGWLSVPFSEEVGGFGGGPVDLMIVLEELGKGLVVEPYLVNVILFGGLLARIGHSPDKEDMLSAIIDGSLQGAFAFNEPQSRYALNDVALSAEAQGDGYTLQGQKTVVYNGMVAKKLIVSARTSGEQCDESGVSLFLVDADSAGITRTEYRLMDGQRVADIQFEAVSGAQLLGEKDNALPTIRAVVNEAIVAISAEAVGIMQALNAITVEYSKTRQQFGAAIGSFQSLQHRMVDMFMAGEQTKSLLYRAVCSLQENDHSAQEVEKDIHALKAMIGKFGRLIGAEAVQIHGGMGITDELNVGHYMKRLMTINTAFGDADYHHQQFADLSNS